MSRDNEDAMKKVNEEKEKINKYLDNGEGEVRHEGPLSEGEDRDDYSSDKFVDRQSYDGKWAEKESAEGGEQKNITDNDIPSETNIEEMDKFLTKVKKEKKVEMIERNKDIFKTRPW